MMSRAQIRAQERRWRRGDSLAIFAAVFLGACMAWILLSVQGLQNDLRTSNEARDALAQQVESLGQKPVAGPPGSRGQPGQTVIGAPGPPGPSGPAGQPGKDAPTITPSPGPTGPAGPAGPPGPTGEPGADSTVPGPAGPAGRDGADGLPGKDGQDGQDGKDGSDGANGAPPSAWTYTDQDGRVYQCTPVADFDPANPRYQCTQTSGPSTAPDPSPSASPEPQPSANSSPGDLLSLLNRRA